MNTQSGLLRARRFAPLFVTQFLGALNDNVLKNAMVVLLTFQAASWTTIKPELLANLAAGIFILPFFLFSATAGQLADKYDKSRLAQFVKLLEIGIVVIAGVGLALHSLAVLFASLFLLGLHSTLFGPVKYAILPQHLKSEELVGGNALIEAGTFIAILVGTLLGGLLAGNGAGTAWITGAGLAIAIAGYVASRSIPSAVPPAPTLSISLNPLTETWRNIQFARENQTVFLSIMGISWFWLFGALFLAQFPAYTKNVLGGSETAVTLLLATFTFGIGVGSLLCEKLSAKRVELGLVPLGSIGMTLFALDLALASPAAPAPLPLGALALLAHGSTWRVLTDLGLLGIFGGFFIVPLYALVQQRSNPEHGARIIAANNIMNALFMVVGALCAAGMLAAGLTIPMLFAVAAICNAAVALFIYGLVPEFLLRFIVWMLIHTVYRLRVEELGQMPEEGPAVIVCNHVSFVDALVIMAACRRPIRFVMDHNIFRWPVLNFVFRTSKAIPIASAKEDPAMMEKAFDEVGRALDAGDLVGIFPEGKITADGNINPFRPGITRILARNPVPVVPLALRGLWGSFFSRKDGAAMTRPFRRGMFSRIELVMGAVVPAAEALPEKLQMDVAALRGDCA
ncbi:MFS transporter [Sulfuritalea hydrogenivorans]|uniref:Phospholipid/glycerol acyltransferase n=1 Tax=Sulfuritalea hydrogenivorans sk43H TaxID=1223802 RepID=W0SAM9_9PROT|nr:MFS transporter [Sulfuritalea hydrogenivorans]BAO28061.1 phospholipid/glycerol acyltransferase [Sulfuritalea hydrogenivorans sk43H]